MRRPLFIALALSLALPGAASAHAQLDGTTPARGAQLDRGPARVVFRFSENVTAGSGSVRVFDGRGREVQDGSPETDGTRVSVRLPGDLPDGGYTATYRVISADSHPVSGGFSFSVGAGGPGPQSVDRLLEASASGPVTATALGAARAVQYAAITLAVGTLLLLLGLWPAGFEAVRPVFAARCARLLVGAAAAGAVSGVAGILLERAQADATLGEVLGTRFGVTWGVGVVAWPALAALRRSRLAVLPVAWLCLLPALGGHAGSEGWLMFGANVVHVVAIAGWIGGLAVLVLALRGATGALPAEHRTSLLAGTLGRFSAFAGVAVAVILATGIVQSVVELSAWRELVHTGYGRAVLVKLGLFAVLLGFGAVNRRRILPALRTAAAAGAAPGRVGVLLRRSLRLELAVGIVVLGVTGALATYAPGKVSDTGPVSESAVLGPARLELTVDPARVGANEVHLYLFERRSGAQWDRAKELTATAERGALELPVDLRKAGPGHYVAAQATLPRRGTWTLAVSARVSAFDEYVAKVKVPVR
ncbi:MAG: copper transport protein [Solirubrobacteraceae bacterium]|nr:copper transport protein [Solirubrobacteraceae bacterium]